MLRNRILASPLSQTQESKDQFFLPIAIRFFQCYFWELSGTSQQYWEPLKYPGDVLMMLLGQEN